MKCPVSEVPDFDVISGRDYFHEFEVHVMAFVALIAAKSVDSAVDSGTFATVLQCWELVQEGKKALGGGASHATPFNATHKLSSQSDPSALLQ